MANVALDSTSARQAFFRQSIYNNLRYWQRWAEKHLSHPDALTTERDSILRALTFAMKLETAWELDYQLILRFSSFMERGGHWQAWESLLRRAIHTARQLGKTGDEAGLSALLGLMLQRQQKYRAAIAQHRHAIQTARRAGNRYAQARSLTNLGYLYVLRGNWWRAEVLCHHALPIFAAVGNTSGMAHTHNHLGLLYTETGNWQCARKHLRQACALWESIGDTHGLMRGTVNLSALAIWMKEPAAAAHLERASALQKASGDQAERGIILRNLSIAHRLTGNFAAAETCARQAEDCFRAQNDVSGMAQV